MFKLCGVQCTGKNEKGYRIKIQYSDLNHDSSVEMRRVIPWLLANESMREDSKVMIGCGSKQSSSVSIPRRPRFPLPQENTAPPTHVTATNKSKYVHTQLWLKRWAAQSKMLKATRYAFILGVQSSTIKLGGMIVNNKPCSTQWTMKNVLPSEGITHAPYPDLWPQWCGNLHRRPASLVSCRDC